MDIGEKEGGGETEVNIGEMWKEVGVVIRESERVGGGGHWRKREGGER